jgi:ribosomal protein S18 acetylase RimI-like enzyme
VRIASGLDPGCAGDAACLVFEYMAATQAETGQRPAARPGDLPAVLRAECEHPGHYYRPPGALLVAYQDGEPAGCVGVISGPEPGTAEIKRLYVRPAYRGRGFARALMEQAHSHAAGRGYDRALLDVLAARRVAIKFYRRLGYRECGAYRGTPDAAMIYLDIELGFHPGAG